MLRRGVVLSGVVLVLIACVASAQPRGGQGRRGFGGRGFGRFGAPQTSKSALLGIEEVQTELGLSSEQKKQVNVLWADLREQARSGGGGGNFRELQNLSQEERAERFAAARKRAEDSRKQAEDKIAKILDAKQLQRLDQLQLQRDGLNAFNRPEIAKRLGLTDDQQAQMRKIRQAARPQGRGGFGGRGQSDEDRRAAFARMQETREKMQADILAVLTDEQKKKWTEMKGEEFEFPRRQGFGGRGGGVNSGERRRPPSKKRDQ
jgi:hypothetical protein